MTFFAQLGSGYHMAQNPTARAEALIEALPFIQKFRGQLFVIKYGGSAMEDEHVVERFLRDVVFLEAVGINPVLIHGGGKTITNRMREAGLKPKFVNGLRVTDEQSIRIVEEVLDNEINPGIVKALNDFGGKASGLHGKHVLIGKKLPPQTEGKATGIDLGFVGEVVDMHLADIERAVSEEKVPVISPLARDGKGVVLNINADIAAGTVAGRLKASKFIYLSDVPGIMRDPHDKESLIPSVNREKIEQLLEEEIISGGMIPKVESAMHALANGVKKVHFIDGRMPHSLLLEIFTNTGVGTEVVA
ncbi:MAG TPA: acetylglutamate kinase [Chthoniobacteraceae bacterium]|nr:acetylglutamate kinase [Chthoniobacteraceae bacterium]